MRKIIFLGVVSLYLNTAYCQDSLLVYSRVLNFDTIGKGKIFDKTLIWCSKAFTDSKSAINVKERDGGLIAGKAFYQSAYKVPKKKDSVAGLMFNNYYFDWLIEIKGNKLRFTANNVLLKELDNDYIVTNKKNAPFEVWLQPKPKTDLEWQLSKEYFLKNIDRLISSLYQEIVKKEIDW